MKNIGEGEEIIDNNIISDNDYNSDTNFSSNENNKCEKQIQICFISNLKDDKYKIENNIYTVPVSFRRIDLSRMIKKLLNIKENISFEFLINKKILRSSIEEFLQLNNILSENVIEVEFTIPITKKESKKIDNISEWISELIIIENTLHCSTFEGNILYYDLTNFNKIYENNVSNMPIFSFNSFKDNKLGSNLYHESIIGLSNGTIKIFLNEEINKGIKTKNQLYLSNHDDMIKSIAINKDASLIISGGTDNKINIYDNNYIIEELKQFKSDNNNKRKKKNVIPPKKSIHKESGIITNLNFFDNIKFLSSGFEKNIKIFDVTNGNIVSSFPYNKSIIRSDIINKNLFIIADENSLIKLFDIRCLNEKSVISLNENKYYSHDKIITSLKGNKNELYFLSSSHDGYINIFDIRLNKLPVYTIENEKKKILSCTWFYRKKNHSIISADEYNINIHNF
ncbi:microtubule-associated protein ytm1 homologue, putative [Plasmodium gallinaceum]|uniref:Microtubule-associated protein ytm1 homologue, putative n=1 Tax=Plasmodium gallinaceum TaxID=5849 RepID=A0A1J1GN72_PLAGA|nr:microtubule-associated protein ytm1 homologue, putative [Plasmodium gallinaceum]CRG93882.1 microtubule-associated protein ytm1 homologue, putative [Plasmodium gallinaceum]